MKIKFFKSADKKIELEHVHSAYLSNDSKEIMKLFHLYEEAFIAFFISRFNLKRQNASDLYKESFSDFCENVLLGRIPELTSSIETYLFRIGINKQYNTFRNEAKFEEDADLSEMANPEESYEWKEQQEIVYKHVLELGEPCNEMLTLSFYERKKNKEIAVIMEYKNEGVVKTRKDRCIKKIKEIIQRNYRREDFEF